CRVGKAILEDRYSQPELLTSSGPIVSAKREFALFAIVEPLIRNGTVDDKNHPDAFATKPLQDITREIRQAGCQLKPFSYEQIVNSINEVSVCLFNRLGRDFSP